MNRMTANINSGSNIAREIKSQRLLSIKDDTGRQIGRRKITCKFRYLILNCGVV